MAPNADEGDGEMVDWTGFDAFEPAKEPAEPELEGAGNCAAASVDHMPGPCLRCHIALGIGS